MRDARGILKKVSVAGADFYGRDLIFMALADFVGGR
jgi:hypothetical protein